MSFKWDYSTTSNHSIKHCIVAYFFNILKNKELIKICEKQAAAKKTASLTKKKVLCSVYVRKVEKVTVSLQNLADYIFSYRFYIGCDLCMSWFHGECVGISERKAKTMDTWVCRDCKQTTPQQELYCICKTPYDDSQ